MDLRTYEPGNFRRAAVSRALPALERTELFEKETGELFRRLEQRFNLVVVGRFSRGKTILMNAVPGLDRLPAGIPPLPSVISTARRHLVSDADTKAAERTLFARAGHRTRNTPTAPEACAR